MNIFSKVISRNYSVFLIISLIGFIVYFRTIFFKLTYLDDNVWLLDYGWYLKDLSNSISLFIQHDLVSKVFYRPVLNLSFMLNASMAGGAPLIYHLTNISIHVINGCLVFILLNKLGYTRALTFIFSLIFTVHPVLTQAVAWIPGRTDSFLALFVFSSFIFFIDFLDKKKFRFLFLHILLFILGFLTKETAVVLPFICFLYISFKINSRQGKGKKLISGTYAILFVAYAVVVPLLFLVRARIISSPGGINYLSAFKSIVKNSPSIIGYLGKIIFPVNLSVLPVLRDTNLIYGLSAVLLLAVLFFISKGKRTNVVLFGICWFLIFILPSLVFSFLDHEYRVYIPIIGLIIFLLEVIRGSDDTIKPRLIIGLLLISFYFSGIAFLYSGNFKDKYTFWKSAVKSSPHCPLAHRNLGAMYHLDEELDKAEIYYNNAIGLNANEEMVHNNLGLIYLKKEKFREAEDEFKKEILINPLYDNVYYNYGLLCSLDGRFEEAERFWEKTIELNPRFINAYEQLIEYYYGKKDLDKVSHYAKILKKQGVEIPDILEEIIKAQ